VVFGADGTSCELAVDDVPLAPEPEPAATSAEDRKGVVLGVLVFGFVSVGFASAWLTARRNVATPVVTTPPAATSARSPRVAESTNGAVRVPYPDGFAARSSGDRGLSFIQLDRDGGEESVLFISDAAPETTDIDAWAFERRIREGEEKHSFTRNFSVESESASEELCHGMPAAIVMRHLVRGETRIRARSCAFLANGKGYRFVTYAPEMLARDEPYLQSLIDGVEL
jgi:hypothetical protein